MFGTLVLETICLCSSPMQLFFLHRTSSCFQRIISSEGFWKRKFAHDNLIQIPLIRQDYVWAWIAEYNKRKRAKMALTKFKSNSGKHGLEEKKILSLEEVNSLGILDVVPLYSSYHCELNFYRYKGEYYYVVNVVKKVDRQPGMFYSDTKRYHGYRKDLSRKDFYNLLFLYYYRLG
nr:hypothetical protein Cduv_381 [Cedratvirus duvanny]